MKKMYVLWLALILFLGSCANLSTDDEAAVKADLPIDFKWQTYAEINNDVKISQIIFDVREKNKEYGKEDSASKAVSNCTKVLQDDEFAKKIYVDYMQCPEQGWNLNEKCSGKYAYNGNYTKVDGTDETCVIDGCWYGGWSELLVDWPNTLKADDWPADWPNTLTEKEKKQKAYIDIVKAMCQFIPKAENTAEAQKYLDDFNYNSYLIEQHYHFFGRSDGRPYRYCQEAVVEKNQSLADKRTSLNNYYYDYSKYTFCLNESDQKIYVVK